MDNLFKTKPHKKEFQLSAPSPMVHMENYYCYYPIIIIYFYVIIYTSLSCHLKHYQSRLNRIKMEIPLSDQQRKEN